MPKFEITEIVSGGCRGTDRLGERYARERGFLVRVFEADWDGPHGRNAGPLRNANMAIYCDALLAIKIDGVESRGTDDMIRRMQFVLKPVVPVVLASYVAFRDA
jgi:hypothetical protein